MSYSIILQSSQSYFILATGIETASEARNAVKVLFAIPSKAIKTAQILNNSAGSVEIWGCDASGGVARLSSNAEASGACELAP